MPCDIVRLPCGSMSTQRTRWPSSTKATARLRVVVVLATPPFWLAKAITLALPFKTRSDHGRENPSQGVCSRRRRRFLPRARGRGRPPRVTIVVMTDGPERTGLAHVATVSFLGSRAAPSAPFWLALPGGVALARVAARVGLRSAYGASAAAVLQTVAVMGPARINNPLTQAMTAPLLGRLEARGRSAWLQILACFGLRFAHYTILSALYIWVVLGGLDAFTGSYQTLTGWLGVLPQGEWAALGLAVAGNLAWAAIYSTIQVLVYRRALRGWPSGVQPVGVEAPGEDAWRQSGRFDPRAVAVAATLATVLLLGGTAWPLLIGVGVWLALAWAFSRADSGAVALGAGLGAMLAISAFTGSLLAGLGLDQALRRGVRAALLVAVATWLRAAAGPEGLREVFRRT